MIIDAHQHYWDPAKGDYGWLQPASPLHRRWLPGDLAPLLAACGIAGTVLVQAAPTEAETDWLLDPAASESSVRGVVGWLDLEAKDFSARLDERRERGLVGIRPMLQDLPEVDWIMGRQRAAGLAALAHRGLAFDALVRPDGLGAVTALADRYPDLRIVLDHAGKPPLGRTGELDHWEIKMRALARRPNVVCKLSGLLTEALPEGSQCVRAAIMRLVEIWTPRRLIWGSDWPVLTLASDYAAWLALANDALGGASEDERQQTFGGNACEVYRL